MKGSGSWPEFFLLVCFTDLHSLLGNEAILMQKGWSETGNVPGRHFLFFLTFATAHATFATAHATFAGGHSTFSGGDSTFSGGYATFSGGHATFSGSYATFSGSYATFSGGGSTFSECTFLKKLDTFWGNY